LLVEMLSGGPGSGGWWRVAASHPALAATARMLTQVLTRRLAMRLRKSAPRKRVLDIPDDVQKWAMIPVGYPTGRGEATYWDGWRATRSR